MNDKNDSHARLVAETFHGDWNGSAASKFALRAAARARTRVKLRHAAATGGGLVAIATGIFFAMRDPQSTPSLVPAVVSTAKPTPAYEIITDDELVALLRDQPLLILPQERGERRFVLLAQSTRD
ncbi:MAG: hypothetical protein ABIQ12_13425 [Opitutaceae bacterium]